MRPFLKWAGGKYRIMDRITKSLPAGERLVEPFVGSGAVFLNTDFPRYLLADTNPDLIGCYSVLKNQPESLIGAVEALFTTRTNTRTFYDRRRTEFNRLRPEAGDTEATQRKAALFIYLNRHCFNGLCRYNRSGGFNVPFGRYSRPYFPETEMRAFAAKLQRADLLWADFRRCFTNLNQGDVVYCDPPYVPLSTTANFTSYAERGFTLADQTELNQLAESVSLQGIPVLISNHETDFTRVLYHRARRISFPVRRFISCKGNKRTQANELLALFA